MTASMTWDRYSISNAQGEPWTPQTWDTSACAQDYLDQQRRDWPRGRRDSGDPLPHHKVVIVEISVTIKE